MNLYIPKKIRGSWHFSSNKYGYDYDIAPYPEIISDLKALLTILLESNILFPKVLGGEGEYIDLEYKNLDDLIVLIKRSGYLQNSFQFDIEGDTVIYTEQGREIHSGIFTLNGFRTFQQSFALSTKSDIWLPMAFDESNYSFVWNLERSNLNYHRIPSILKRINNTLKWKNENLFVKELHERGCVQVGYDIFLSQEVIKKEFDANPNLDFDLAEYVSKIK